MKQFASSEAWLLIWGVEMMEISPVIWEETSVVIDDVVLCLQILSTRKNFTPRKVNSLNVPCGGHTSIPDPLEASVSEVAELCPTVCDPMDYSLSGSSVHGILQARALEWIAISFSRGIFPTQG